MVCLQLRAKCLSPDDELNSASTEIIKLSDVNTNAGENRFQNGPREKGSQILSNQVLDIENFTRRVGKCFVSLLPLPCLKEPEILEYALRKSSCTSKAEIPSCKVLGVCLSV